MPTEYDLAVQNSLQTHERETNGSLYNYTVSSIDNEYKNCNTDNLQEKRLGIWLAYAKMKVNCSCNGFYKTLPLHNFICPKNNDLSPEEWSKNKLMKCLYCKKIQNINNTCKFCHKVLGDYYCGKCKILLNIKNCSIYINHCDKCNACIHSSCKNKNYHCKKCNKCHNDKIDCSQINNSCPICLENIISASPHSKGITFRNRLFKLPCCKNIIHTGCLINNKCKTCPFCRKNIENINIT